MRLTESQIAAIKASFTAYFLTQDKLWLFGSRVDPLKKGGDIDLYIETVYPDFAAIVPKELDFLVDLKKKIGDQKIDLVINCLPKNRDLPIYREAKSTGVQLI